MNIEQLTLRTQKTAFGKVSYAQLKRLVERASDDGVLTCEENEVIIAAITSSDRPTAEMCGLFRQLQEQVWSGDLVLESPRHHHRW
jgi:hypothetical protein